MTTTPARISDLTPDPSNANRGTERGSYMVRKSLEKLGAGRSVLVDKNGVLIAGNKTAEAAYDIGMEEAIVVPTDGTRLVVVQRTDLDLATDPKAKELAIADNRAGEVGLAWDEEVLSGLAQDVTLGDWFTPEEMAGWEVPEESQWAESLGALPDGDRAPFQQMTFTLHDDQAEQVKAAIEAAKDMGPFDSENENSNGNALARICEAFLNGNG
jgi:ParB-like chromosome segregation protein Spo0J